MLTQTCPADWPLEINKHTSEPLRPQAAEFSVRLKIRNGVKPKQEHLGPRPLRAQQSLGQAAALQANCLQLDKYREGKGLQTLQGSNDSGGETTADPKH